MAKVRIILHGNLKNLVPEGLAFEVNTAREAIEALCSQVKSLHPLIGQPRQKLRVIGFDTVESLIAPIAVDELHLIPVLGGGKSGFFQIALGVVLIAVSFWNPAGLMGLSLMQGVTIGSIMFSVGLSMVLGGLAQMLAPAPTIDTRSDPEASKILPSQQNTVKIGTRIPIGYGRHRVYGHYLSFNIQSTDVVTATLT